MKQGKARHPLDWLGSQNTFQDLSSQANRLREMQGLLDECAPVRGLRIKALEQSVLLISAPSASAAAKFRQFEPRILRIFTDRGWKVSRIRVRPQLIPDEAQASRAPAFARPALSESAIAGFSALIQQGQETRLTKAIAHFLSNQRSVNRIDLPATTSAAADCPSHRDPD